MNSFDKNELYQNSYKSSKIVDLQSYFDAYRGLIKSSNFYQHYKMNEKYFVDTISDKGNVDEKLLKELAKHCSIDNLTVVGELKKMTKSTYEFCKDPLDPSIIDNVQLKTVKHTKIRNKIDRSVIVPLSKYISEKNILYEKSTVKSTECLEPENDILVYIKVYKPFNSKTYSKKHSLQKVSNCKVSVHTVTAMHGSQTLDMLKDKIFCYADNSVSQEISKKPVRFKVPNAKDVYKSGFFYIEGTFYNDFRDPTNKDNSKVIRDWAEKHRYGTYHTAKMEETKISSLILKFGFPYVYQHQGDCEHLITFSNAMLVNPTYELNPDCYPRIIRLKPHRCQYCMTCGVYNALWVVSKNQRLPHNPCLFCDFCFKSYNYIKGKKVGHFEAHPYPYDSELDSRLST